MNQNKKFLVYSTALVLIFFSYYIYQRKLQADRRTRVTSALKLEFEDFRVENQGKLLDVNEATEEMLLRKGISLSISEKILEYRDIVGFIEHISDLERVSGIGKKTLEKLGEFIEVREGGKRKPFNINKADSKTLRYYGFTKLEIKRIEDWKRENNEVYSNIELRGILGIERYGEYRSLVKYNDYD